MTAAIAAHRPSSAHHAPSDRFDRPRAAACRQYSHTVTGGFSSCPWHAKCLPGFAKSASLKTQSKNHLAHALAAPKTRIAPFAFGKIQESNRPLFFAPFSLCFLDLRLSPPFLA